MGLPENHVHIDVEINKNSDGTYSWSYQSEYDGVVSKTGKVTLKESGLTKITYKLLSEGYNLIYVNLDPDVCATREIHNVAINVLGNSITLTDANSNGETGSDPFSLRLIARVAGSTSDPIVSPDPEVVNDPNVHSPSPTPVPS